MLGSAARFDDPIAAAAFLLRLESCAPTPSDLERLAAAACARTRGSATLDDLLGLPRVRDDGKSRASRILWMHRAFTLLADSVEAFECRWRRFASTTYRNWSSDSDEPPEWASKLDAALFKATRFNGGESLSTKQIARDLEQLTGACCSGQNDPLFLSKGPAETAPEDVPYRTAKDTA